MTSFDIGGIIVETSDRGTTGYLGATFSPDWREETPFIAAVSNPTDPNLTKLFRRPDSTSLHLGDYNDAREAAYAVAYYKANPKEALINVEQNVTLDIDFPPELYDLPVYYTLSDAQSAIRTAKANKKSGATSSRRFKIDIQGSIAAFHKAHGSDYKVTGADAPDIRAAIKEHLDTVIGKPNQANMDIATRLAFEPYKK